MSRDIATVPLRQVVALVALGAVAGSLLRATVSTLIPLDTTDGAWPWATFAVNLAGCLIMGGFLGRVEVMERVPPYGTPLIATGFLGGLTTFSAFAAESVELAEAGFVAISVAYVVLSVTLGIAAVRVGWNLALRGSR